MSQNRKFRLRYDELRDGNPAKISDKNSDEDIESSSQNENKFYDRPGNVRHLHFVWLDGRRMFLNYAYLVSGELNVTEDANMISLCFTSHTVILKGYDLEKLFSKLGDQTSMMIAQVDPRYVDTLNEKSITVTEIFVEQNK